MALVFFVNLYELYFMPIKRKYIIIKAIAIVWLSLLGLGVYAQQDWRLKKDEDGIKVFTACTDNSDFKTIKVECEVKARPSQVVALLMDIDKQHE